MASVTWTRHVLDAVLECPAAADVRRMGQHAPGIVLEAVPLLGEVIADVIADLFDQLAVRDGNFVQMRGDK